MALYSDKVMEHFMNPRNVGEIADADGVGEVGNPVCGDMMTFYIKVDDGVIKDVKFKTFGCGAAIAVSSMVSEMAKGKTLEEALRISNDMVAEELGGLPKNKLHCSNLGADALHAAIKDYMKKHGIPVPPEAAGGEEEEAGLEGEGFKVHVSTEVSSEGEEETAGGGEEPGQTTAGAGKPAPGGETEGEKPIHGEHGVGEKEGEHEHVLCPYCDEPLEGSTSLLCSRCHISFIECPRCGKIVGEQLDKCPHCGASLSAQ